MEKNKDHCCPLLCLVFMYKTSWMSSENSVLVAMLVEPFWGQLPGRMISYFSLLIARRCSRCLILWRTSVAATIFSSPVIQITLRQSCRQYS